MEYLLKIEYYKHTKMCKIKQVCMLSKQSCLYHRRYSFKRFFLLKNYMVLYFKMVSQNVVYDVKVTKLSNFHISLLNKFSKVNKIIFYKIKILNFHSNRGKILWILCTTFNHQRPRYPDKEIQKNSLSCILYTCTC